MTGAPKRHVGPAARLTAGWLAHLVAALIPFVLFTAPAPADVLRVPGVTITRLDAPEIVFDWRRDRCETIDTPDAPARAFQDSANMVHLISSHYITQEMTGPMLDTLRHHCDRAFTSTMDRRYDTHRNAQWLTGFYTVDGNTVHALVHNEFDGGNDPNLCRPREPDQCWWNSITYAVSTDGGYHFHEARAGNRVVAVLPYPYAGDGDGPAGYFIPTNIVALDRYYYAIIKATAYRAQRAGSCLIRTATLDDAASWRAWDGSGFGVRFVDRLSDATDPAGAHACTPIAKAMLGDVGGISRDEDTSAFVSVMQGLLPNGDQRLTCGIWASASYDLISWSTPVLVWSDAAPPASCDRAMDLYPSILDPRSATRNFESFRANPYIYFVRADLTHRPYDRRLMRQRVRIALDVHGAP